MSKDLLDELIHQAKGNSTEEFVRLQPNYFFLVRIPGGDDDFDYMEFHTENHSKKHQAFAKSLNLPEVAVAGGDDNSPGKYAFEVKKQAHNGWLEWISIGRATNNDIVIRHQSVSKLHAKIHTDKEGTGAYWITDLDSSGTWINGNLLDSSEPLQLSIGDTIRCGQVECEFLMGETLYHTLRRMI